jgi:hypothetical protein
MRCEATSPVAVLRVDPSLLDGHPAATGLLLYAFDFGRAADDRVGATRGCLTKCLGPRPDRSCARGARAVSSKEARLIEEELRSLGASGAQPVIDRHRKVLDDISGVLTPVGGQEST